jgi:hypothetical protein
MFTKLTPTRLTLLQAALRVEGRPYVAAARLARISRTTLWRWRRRPDLRAALSAPRPPGIGAVDGAWSLLQSRMGTCPTCGRGAHEP